jgi:hypothetical protein
MMLCDERSKVRAQRARMSCPLRSPRLDARDEEQLDGLTLEDEATLASQARSSPVCETGTGSDARVMLPPIPNLGVNMPLDRSAASVCTQISPLRLSG